MLMPIVSLNLNYTNKKFDVNSMQQNIDEPVFSIEDAILQINSNVSNSFQLNKNDAVGLIDQFFLKNLPKSILD